MPEILHQTGKTTRRKTSDVVPIFQIWYATRKSWQIQLISQELVRRGAPWTEDKRRFFLLGKGDWHAIARSYVVSRTPTTQVANHTTKYFIQQSIASRGNRLSSLFDMIHQISFARRRTNIYIQSEMGEADNAESLPS
ncbi:hypothetical protein MKW98_006465 [Papaver atlanticum]|uniref:Myb-like domain-containing protein n=1 Tax=Papaver atlanticum TaxID=357466 RepID=A0AAD4XD59_9MAGN|nr:hypothetical protein MKW98_006465 [Papaver atlanticum]